MDWKLFASTFGLVFVAEIPDKTAFLSVLLAGKHRPFGVFIGASLAFVVQSIVAVSCGSLIGMLPARGVQIGAGIMFLFFAIQMWRRPVEAAENGEVRESEVSTWKVISAAFLTIFVAEWGDLTQLATAALAAKYRAPVTIFLSATLALWAVTGIAVVVGHQAKRVLRPDLMQRIAAVAFALVGAFLLSGVKA